MGKRKTHEQFLQEVYNLVGGEYTVLEEYKGVNEKIKFKHNLCKTEFTISPNKFLSGQRCPFCSKKNLTHNKKNTETFKKEVEDLVGDEYSVLEEYRCSKTKILLKHNKCHKEFMMTPSNFLNGQRCPHCKGKRQSEAQLQSDEDFKKRIETLCLEEYKEKDMYIPLSNYQGMYEPIIFLHKQCGKTFKTTPQSFIHKHTRCLNKECLHDRMSNSMKLTHEDFLSRVKKIYKNNEYEIISEYQGYKTPIKIKHLTCGTIFEKRPDNFLHGQGCPKCSLDSYKEKKTKSQEEYKLEIKNLYGDEFTVVSEYKAGIKPIKIKHNVCGNVFEVTAQNMLNVDNYHCPYCSHPTKGEQKIINYLDSHNEKYIYQKRYKDLHGIGNGLLSYDFYVPHYNLLIEYQGNFHDGTASIQTEESFEMQKEHDKRKRNDAKYHGINLLEIWYWDFDNIENILKEQLDN